MENKNEFIKKIKKIIEENLPDTILNITSNVSNTPLINIDRKKFLKRELRKYYSDEIIKKAIETNPYSAGIPIDIINKIADNCIKYERSITTATAAVLGAPGIVSAPVFAGILIADISQYYGFLLRIMQKLLYLYGFPEIKNVEDEVDDETKFKLLQFMCVMLSVNNGANNIGNLAKDALQKQAKNIVRQSLTKTTTWYPLLKDLAKKLGKNLTKKGLEKSANKVIPFVGAVINGGATYIVFKQQANNLKNYLINFYGKDF